MKETAEFVDCAERLKALADADRLRIVQCLFHGPLTVGRLADSMQEDIVKVSHHLAILRRTKILQAKKQGRFVEYSIHPDVSLDALKDNWEINLGCCRFEILHGPA